MKRFKSIATLFFLLAVFLPASPLSAQTNPSEGSDLKYGLYIHFGIATFAQPGQQGRIPAQQFNPTSLNVLSWVRAAKDAGMTFAVLTAKHVSGFVLWDSPGYDYGVDQSPCKADIIGDFIGDCQAEGIVPGIYYSIPDAYNEGAVINNGPVPDQYFDLIKQQITQLHTRYPGIRIEIINGIDRLSPDQLDQIRGIIKQLTPDCILLNSGDRKDVEPQCGKDTIVRGWMWSPQAQISSASALFDHYNNVQAAGQAFVLNVGPDTSGRIPAAQTAVLAQMKELIQEANAPVTAESLKRGLILDFDFDQQPVNGHVADMSGSGNEGTAVGVQWVADGHRGGSVQFAKNDSYITVPNNSMLNPQQFTLSAWIKTSYTDAIWRRIFDKATSVGYDLTMDGNLRNGKSAQGQFSLEVGNGALGSKVNVNDGLWHQVVGTFDGDQMRIFVDGQQLGGPRHPRTPPARTLYDLTIGANRSNPDASLGEVGPSFYGMMDDVMMYDRALIPKEVKALYDMQKTATDVPLSTNPAPSPNANPSPQNQPSAADRLKAVKALYDQGLINKDQYDQKVQQIMNSL